MKILFIITASIAIKRCNEILEKLSSKNIIIDCIVTNNAKKMSKINKFKRLIKGKVYTDESEMKNKMLHISLSRKCDLIVVCPATANTIAKFSNGYADNLASATLLASNKQILFVPAMNKEMWNNSVNQKNVSKLKNMGVEFIGPEYGRLSCGESGLGRISNTKKILNTLIRNLNRSEVFKNKKCIITAGPTVEPIDSVRFLSNYSSGKQGYEIAKQMILSGAKVTLISGPTNLQTPYNCKLIKVKTANEMFNAVKKNIRVDIAIFAAAVSDVSPKKFSQIKIKKNKLNFIDLVNNKDIVKEISCSKKLRPKIVIGFAAETNNHFKNASAKLFNKKCDAIILNKINNNMVFGSDYNQISFITKKERLNFKKMSKTNVAKKIVDQIRKL
tara:strand:- start:2021 stop:3184 length:1164 start_codon:yes stop_codon:yes gene_type:complete